MDPVAFYQSNDHEVTYRFKALAALFNQLIELPLADPTFGELLDELAEYLGPHLTFETLLMAECRYPTRTRHERHHVRLRRQIHVLRSMADDDPVLPHARKAFLKTLEAHLTLEDNDLIKFANNYEAPASRQITTTIVRRRPSDSEGRLQPAR